ncbi:hypothetical protein LIER_05494 [Lithospermum erythrorhizon]|uniref:RPAP1/MINIYO-like TPR repeats domain-containing protein n=1 Tax=Lithospermum erythrorhizon TaxID=34254 RepID=A0AAV3P0T4_LITER
MATINHTKKTDLPPASNMEDDMESNLRCLEVFRAGLFFSLGLEAMSAFLPSESQCFVWQVPVVWKLHALSVILMNGMDFLVDKKTRDVYGHCKLSMGNTSMNSESDVHESYSTFIETLVEQFAAVSYGDLLFGCQIAIYLHMFVESPVKLATWKVLSNAHDDEKILEAYAQSWVSGALDRAATRSSAAFTLALHHLSSFVFGNCPASQISLRNKLVKSLLRDYTRKGHHKGMLFNFMHYKYSTSLGSSLLLEVEKLEAFVLQKDQLK